MSETEKSNNKMTVERSVISTPYSPPNFVFKRIINFSMDVLGKREFKPLEEVSNDFHELEPSSVGLLAIGAVDHFEIQLCDMSIKLKLLETMDKSSEDMSLPLMEILGPLASNELTMILHLKPTASSSADRLIEDSKAINLKAIKFQVVRSNDSEYSKEEKRT